MGIDLFMSHTAADFSLADSLAWKLESAGHRVVMSGGQVATGVDITTALLRRRPAEMTIAVLSPSYLALLKDQPTVAEMVRTQATGAARTVVAVRVRECTPDGLLAGVPYLDVVGLDDATAKIRLRELLQSQPMQPVAPSMVPPKAAPGPADPAHELHDVFKRSGIPTVTFVEPEDFDRLILSLRQPGRGIVIEGPSGIGKTSALRQALKNLEGDTTLARVPILNARQPDDVERLRALSSWHRGTVAIDDFHRLEPALRDRIGNYVKYLGDAERDDLRIVLVGIPGTGQHLIEDSFDLAGRVDIFTLDKVKDEAILTMIAKGEQALNVSLDNKEDLVRAASGSLHVAQILSYEVCIQAGIFEKRPHRTPIASDVDAAVARALQDMGTKFRDLIVAFESAGGDDDDIGHRLLQELARSQDGSLALRQLSAIRPDLADGIWRFIHGNFIAQVKAAFPEYERHILYDDEAARLTFDDPQLAFYLKATIGGSRNRVFVSYSHRDERWLSRMLVHLTPLQNEGAIDVWSDTRLRPGDDWQTKIEQALESASVAVLLVSADFLASQFVVENELPPLLRAAETNGTTILPVIVGPSSFQESPSLRRFQAVNDPRTPLLAMKDWEQETLFHNVAKAVKAAVRRSSGR
jgi:TIR domain